MAEYTICIDGAPRGAYNKVKAALKGLDHSYDKAGKVFTFSASEDEADNVGVGLTAIDAGLARQLSDQMGPEPTAPVLAEDVAADPEPEPEVASSPRAASAPAPPTWTVECAGKTLTVESDTCPSAYVFSVKLGGPVTIKDAAGNLAASWP